MNETLTRYDLVKSDTAGWELKRGGRVVIRKGSKGEFLKDLEAILRRVGDGTGTVRIHTELGSMEEERTFPRAKDPRKSYG